MEKWLMSSTSGFSQNMVHIASASETLQELVSKADAQAPAQTYYSKMSVGPENLYSQGGNYRNQLKISGKHGIIGNSELTNSEFEPTESPQEWSPMMLVLHL